MRKPIDAPRPRLAALAACLLSSGLLAACNSGPALDLRAQAIGESPEMASTQMSGQPLPLPEPVLTPVQRSDAALAGFLGSREIEEVPGYLHATTDLDEDGINDLLMLLQDPNWCDSSGCSLLVFHGEADDSYRLVTQATVTRAPIASSTQRHKGWHDLLVGVGGGGTQAGTVALQFDGDSYPSNPTLLALLADGTVPRAQVLIE